MLRAEPFNLPSPIAVTTIEGRLYKSVILLPSKPIIPSPISSSRTIIIDCLGLIVSFTSSNAALEISLRFSLVSIIYLAFSRTSLVSSDKNRSTPILALPSTRDWALIIGLKIKPKSVSLMSWSLRNFLIAYSRSIKANQPKRKGIAGSCRLKILRAFLT